VGPPPPLPHPSPSQPMLSDLQYFRRFYATMLIHYIMLNTRSAICCNFIVTSQVQGSTYDSRSSRSLYIKRFIAFPYITDCTYLTRITLNMSFLEKIGWKCLMAASRAAPWRVTLSMRRALY